MFEITILGSSSALPTLERNPTSQLINVKNHFYLIDCGEGTQIRLREIKAKTSKIDNIFISHLHGDHYFGLIGLLSTYHLLRRNEPLHIYAPAPLEEIIQVQLKHSHTKLNYPLHFHPLDIKSKPIIYEDDVVSVELLQMNHRIECYGFLFREKADPLNIKKEKIQEYNIPVELIPGIKKGEDFILPSGEKILNKELTFPPTPPKSYAFFSDTTYQEELIPKIKNIDLLYHEATFMEKERKQADNTFHSTASDAANMAKKANVKKLLIGHFSSRYEDLNLLLEEAIEVFPNTELVVEKAAYQM